MKVGKSFIKHRVDIFDEPEDIGQIQKGTILFTTDLYTLRWRSKNYLQTVWQVSGEKSTHRRYNINEKLCIKKYIC